MFKVAKRIWTNLTKNEGTVTRIKIGQNYTCKLGINFFKVLQYPKTVQKNVMLTKLWSILTY